MSRTLSAALRILTFDPKPKKDTHLVDSNVTRHLDILLADSATPSPSPSSEWDALILHYLGLDHVGHLEGPKRYLTSGLESFSSSISSTDTSALFDSAMMKPKQREMDQVFERLFKAMSTRDEQDGEKSLLVLIGDHGMTEVSLGTLILNCAQY